MRSSTTLGIAVIAGALAFDPAALAVDPKRVLLAVVAIVACAAGVASCRRVSVTGPVALFAGFVAWSGASVAWGSGAGTAEMSLLVTAAVLGVVGSSLPRADARRLAEIACVGIGGGAALVLLAQASMGADGIARHGGMGNNNWLGLLLAVTLLPSAGAARRALEEQRGAWSLIVASAVVQLAGWLAAGSRVAWVALPVAVGCAWWFSRGHHRAGYGIVGVALVATATSSVAFNGVPSLFDGSDALGSLSGRFWVWRASAAAGLGHLPWGTGFGDFGHAYLDAQGTMLASLDPAQASRTFVNATSAHNSWLGAFVETGPVGALLLASAIALGMVRVAPRWPAGAAALVALAVSASGDSPFKVPALVVVVVLVLAVGPRVTVPALPVLTNGKSRSRRMVWATALVVSAVSATPALRSWLGTRALSAARTAPPAERSALLEHARTIDDRSGWAALERGLDLLEHGEHTTAIRELERSRSLLGNVGTDVALGNAHLRQGDEREAVRSYRRALRRHPGSFRAHANIAVALSRMQESSLGEDHLRIARRLWPGHPKLATIQEAVRLAKLDAETLDPERSR